jgi:hypothetical protein
MRLARGLLNPLRAGFVPLIVGAMACIIHQSRAIDFVDVGGKRPN